MKNYKIMKMDAPTHKGYILNATQNLKEKKYKGAFIL
jgi:hypothetical protein